MLKSVFFLFDVETSEASDFHSIVYDCYLKYLIKRKVLTYIL